MKSLTLSRPGYSLFLIISGFVWGAVTLRWISEFSETDHPLTWPVAGILFLFGLLLLVGPPLVQRSPALIHLYLALQTSLVLVASLFHFELDFFALLYVPLCGQAVYLLPRRQAYGWLVLLIAATVVGQIIQFGGPQAFSFSMLYAAALVFVTAFVSMNLQANDARRQSEQLLTELQSAHQQLQAYAGQAEQLAVANERTRLARDLHDSVAQTLYGLTLQAEAASRQLRAGKYTAAQNHLNEMRVDARQTLQETRLLIFELRPPILEQSGLAAALKARLDTVEARSGLRMVLSLQEVDRLPAGIETNLYRIAQEALNNSAKHAAAAELQVTLVQSPRCVTLEIADNGVGFDPTVVPPGRIGLESMKERARQMDATISIQSAPGQGTRIQLEVPL